MAEITTYEEELKKYKEWCDALIARYDRTNGPGMWSPLGFSPAETAHIGEMSGRLTAMAEKLGLSRMEQVALHDKIGVVRWDEFCPSC